ncbi:hypothetical protein FF1_009208 [Malus domestica]
MIPAITRWDASMIHKAIKDVLVEKIKKQPDTQDDDSNREHITQENNLQRENDIKREQRNGGKLLLKLQRIIMKMKNTK